MNIPSVLIRISTGEILRHADLPISDPTQPVPGLDPDLKWLIKNQPFSEPDYDERIFILNRIETVTATAHPTYPLYDQYLITFTTAKRTKQEIKEEVNNARRAALQRVWKPEEQLETLAVLGSILLRKIDGLTLTPEEQEAVDRIIEIGDQHAQNEANSRSLKTRVDNDEEPDLDDGWVEPE